MNSGVKMEIMDFSSNVTDKVMSYELKEANIVH